MIVETLEELQPILEQARSQGKEIGWWTLAGRLEAHYPTAVKHIGYHAGNDSIYADIKDSNIFMVGHYLANRDFFISTFPPKWQTDLLRFDDQESPEVIEIMEQKCDVVWNSRPGKLDFDPKNVDLPAIYADVASKMPKFPSNIEADYPAGRFQLYRNLVSYPIQDHYNCLPKHAGASIKDGFWYILKARWAKDYYGQDYRLFPVLRDKNNLPYNTSAFRGLPPAELKELKVIYKKLIFPLVTFDCERADLETKLEGTGLELIRWAKYTGPLTDDKTWIGWGVGFGESKPLILDALLLEDEGIAALP